MLKPILVFFFGLFFFQTAKAQRDTTLLYMKNSGQIVAKKDSADYLILVLPPDSNLGKKLYPVNGYYLNGKPRLVETVEIIADRTWQGEKSRSSTMLTQGPCISFYSNGHKKSIENYVNGIQVGDVTEYYPNGKRYSLKKLDQRGKLLLIDCRDSTGNVLAENGNGTWLTYDESFKTIIDKGSVQDSLEEGEWKETIGNSIFKSLYKKGELISTNDTTKVFSKVENEPEFKDGGIVGFYHFLGRTIHYPSYAKENTIQGKALITFIVEKDGSLTHGKILKDPGGGIGDEALRAVMLSPNWLPGMQGDRPVRVQYTVPVSFTLTSDEK